MTDDDSHQKHNVCFYFSKILSMDRRNCSKKHDETSIIDHMEKLMFFFGFLVVSGKISIVD